VFQPLAFQGGEARLAELLAAVSRGPQNPHKFRALPVIPTESPLRRQRPGLPGEADGHRGLRRWRPERDRHGARFELAMAPRTAWVGWQRPVDRGVRTGPGLAAHEPGPEPPDADRLRPQRTTLPCQLGGGRARCGAGSTTQRPTARSWAPRSTADWMGSRKL